MKKYQSFNHTRWDCKYQCAAEEQEGGSWRVRMGAGEGKTIYKDRAATAECVNAQARGRGLTSFRVRSVAKAKGVVLLFALAHNLMRMFALAPELLGLRIGTSSVTSWAT